MALKGFLLIVTIATLSSAALAREPVSLQAASDSTQLAPAPAVAVSPELRGRAEQILNVLGGGLASQMGSFTDRYLNSIGPNDRWLNGLAMRTYVQYGNVQRVSEIDAESATSGIVHIEAERAVIHVRVRLEPQAPHRIDFLEIIGADIRPQTGRQRRN
jgi:hypothetical protein